ncbi:DNA mismatch repair endonuclease MutL [Caldicoprobacter algeriensis]|uniref:DNA mismatch repair endonuclease MutL n=1 Tax=Caldicoprobacter algeriensis TaxID=699281 RepID=UPI00207AE150|nr:DNA mismatch repair endonuclease MutL [Caldicoprobacter algeriensis]MCM8901161.1 DNA mismatch repair endonuclease MutL [Caldicoprobacter algeriensis]
MPKINILDEFTINQIAAGEVVERPASVVKELVENSIDASSSAITIEIKDGGIPFIRVTDNGEGMDQQDARLCFERHATSKIKSSDDLYEIHSLGFRGEALASIAAVSQVEIFTRPRNSLSGTHVINHGGNVISVQEVGCPEGTTVIVRNIFYNAPARLKFLKAPRTEAAYISDLVAKLILAHPEISFRYINNGKAVYHSPGNGDLLSAIISVYGREVRGQVIKIDRSDDKSGLSIYGYLGRPSLARMNRNHQSFFVNGRYVKSPLLSRSLEEAHRSYLPLHHFPWAVLHISIPASQVDVNVHPAKTEIRFRQEEEVYSLIFQWVREALDAHPYIPDIKHEDIQEASHPDAPNQDGKEIDQVDVSSQELKLKQEQVSFLTRPEQVRHVYVYDDRFEQQEKKYASEGLDRKIYEHNINGLVNFKIVGRIFSTYVIVESEDSVFFIDQHAAHERLIYEQLKRSMAQHNVASQQLLPPVVIQLSHDEHILLQEALEAFKSLGFELEPFGGNAWAVRGIPAVVSGASIKELFYNVLDQWKGERDAHLSIAFKPHDIMKIACKHAVKARDPLSDREILSLLNDIQDKKIPLTCPHGRPIVVTITKYELEKKFKRIQ